MQGTAQITMADPKPPSPEDTAQTIASIEAQLDDLLDAIDQHQPAPPATPATPAPAAPAAQAMPPTHPPTELDDIADALEAVGDDASEHQAIDAAPEAISPLEAEDLLAEVNDALAGIEQEAPPPPDQTTPQPAEAQAIGQAHTDTPAQAHTEAPADDFDAEVEALLAEQPISDDVFAAAELIAKDDAAKAEEQQEALAQRAETAKQNLMSREDASDQAPPDEPDFEAASNLDSLEGPGDTNTQEQIAQEIEDLLAAEANEPTPDEPAAAEPSIDQIDQMLAEEIDTDDELVGDFQSVEDVAEGIVPSGEGETINLSGEPEGASADDVASELDSQPEDLAQTSNADEPEDTVERKTPKWKGLLKVAERVALRVCWTLNWPLRQNPVTPQWRSTVGYVALLNLAVGSALFAVGVAKLVF